MKQRKNAGVSPEKDGIEYPKSSKGENKVNPNLPPSPPKRIFLICLVFRMASSLMVQTYFNPDEHWQTLEVAHRIAFGYGHLTWEWKKGIRSYLHPMLFALLYKVLSFLHLDIPWFMIKAPRLLQSVISAFGDLYLYKLSQVLFGIHAAQWALFSQLTNWFMFYCIPRTLSNSLETVVTLVGLYYWPCMQDSSGKASLVSRKWGLAAAVLACAIRRTSAITWVYVGLLELYVTRDRLKFIFLEVAPIGDNCAWTDMFIGLLDGFSVMLFTFIPFSFAGIIQSKQSKVSGLILWVLGLYSVLGHKEFRFVLPVLPIALVFSGYSLARISGCDLSNDKGKTSPSIHTKCSSKLQVAVFFLLMTNVPMAFYISMAHQRN